MNILLGLFYFLLLSVIFFWLYLLVSFRRTEDEEKRGAIEEKFVISVSVLFFWYGPCIIFFLTVMTIIDILSKFLP